MEDLYKKQIRTEKITTFVGMCLLSVGVVLSVEAANLSANENTEVVETFNDNAVISYYNFELPGDYHFEYRDDKQVVVRTSEIVVGEFDDADMHGEYAVPTGYYLKPTYYGFKKIVRIKNGEREEQIIRTDAIEAKDENGNITYVVPTEYELGIKYKLIKYVEEVIYLDDYMNENNELDENKLLLRLSRG